MSAIKSGTTIRVEGTGNTLASITSDIADPTFIEETSSGVYVVHGAHVLDLWAGSELTVGSEADYSVREELHFNPTTHGFPGFNIRAQSTFKMFGNVVLNLALVPGKACRPVAWGGLYWRGSDPVLGSELLVDGDMESADTSAWTANNSASLSKEVEGSGKILRIAFNSVTNPSASQNVVTSGTKYRITGRVRSDGIARPLIDVGGGGTVAWYGLIRSEWQTFSFDAVADDSLGVFLMSETTSSGYTEWDDVSVKEITTQAYRPLYKGFDALYLYDSTGDLYLNDLWDIEKIDLGWGYQGSGKGLSGGYAFGCTSLYAASYLRHHRFVDIGVNWEGVEPAQYGFMDVFNATGANRYDPSARWTMENIRLKRVYRGVYYGYNHCLAKVKNCKLEQNYAMMTCVGGPRGQTVYKHVSQGGIGPALANTFAQHFFMFEDCEFRDGYRSSATDRSVVSASYGGSCLLFKNCTFTYRGSTPATANVATSNWDGQIWWLGNTGNFLDKNCFISALSYASLYYAFALNLTVVDISGDPLEDAQIVVRQCENKEVYHFITDSLGKPRTQGLLNGAIILVNYEASQFRWDTQENFGVQGDKWSDPSNDTYHEITVFKKGYGTTFTRVVMNQDRDVTLTLTGYGALGQ